MSLCHLFGAEVCTLIGAADATSRVLHRSLVVVAVEQTRHVRGEILDSAGSLCQEGERAHDEHLGIPGTCHAGACLWSGRTDMDPRSLSDQAAVLRKSLQSLDISVLRSGASDAGRRCRTPAQCRRRPERSRSPRRRCRSHETCRPLDLLLTKRQSATPAASAAASPTLGTLRIDRHEVWGEPPACDLISTIGPAVQISGSLAPMNLFSG